MKETINAFSEKYGVHTQEQVKHRLRKCNLEPKDRKFKKGHNTWNKGMSIKEERPDIYEKYYDPNRINKKPHGFIKCRKPIGYTMMWENKYYVKVDEPEIWVSRARHIYEKYHEIKLSEKDKILHLDGDASNDNPENLIVVNNKILARLNKKKLIFSDGELTRSAVYQQMILQTIKEIEDGEEKDTT